MSGKGKRLDVLLEEGAYFPSRQSARTAIMNGAVLVNGVKVTKPGTHIKEGAKIELTKLAKTSRYVSRGGFKLEKALQEFSLSTEGRVCLDVGASTGGFTDCLLQHGASFVYAVDVGHGQMVWSLRTDPRVKVFERWNARSLSLDKLLQNDNNRQNAELPEGSDVPELIPTLAVIDVSFISISKILSSVIECLPSNDAQIVALVKPQFEAGREQVGKGGVVRAAEAHVSVIANVISAAGSLELKSTALTFSPLKGPEGNIEFLLLIEKIEKQSLTKAEIEVLVSAAHQSLNT